MDDDDDVGVGGGSCSLGVVVDDEDGLRSSCWAMVKMASRPTTLDDMISVVF